MSAHSSASASATSSPLKGYFAVWIALLVGTGLTVYAATLDLAPYNAAVALADDLLDRRGRMTEAVEAMGGNGFAIEGVPFDLAARH